MEYRRFGNTGIAVSELCLGGMTFGNEADELETEAIIRCFLQNGGDFIDTAIVYTRGRSEELIGRVSPNSLAYVST